MSPVPPDSEQKQSISLLNAASWYESQKHVDQSYTLHTGKNGGGLSAFILMAFPYSTQLATPTQASQISDSDSEQGEKIIQFLNF